MKIGSNLRSESVPSVPMPAARELSPGKSYAVVLERTARIGAVLVSVLGAAVIAGWFLEIAALKSVFPGLATMKLNTAAGFLAAGVSLWLIHSYPAGSRALLPARMIAAMVAALGAATLFEFYFVTNLSIDEFLRRDDSKFLDTLHPGRMSEATALNFFLLGLALLSLKARRYYIAACSHWLVAPPICISALAIAGYTYGVSSLYHVAFFTSMALHTAVTFNVIALSILAANSRFGFARVAGSDTVGGALSRWLLPSIPLMLFVLGFIILKAEEAGYYDYRFSLALIVLLGAFVCTIAVAWTAIVLHRTDITRQRAEAENRNLNIGLEQRVQERTEELSRLSIQLGEANKALETLSLRDGLTGLANRRSFDAHLALHIAAARRDGLSLSLIMCDVDSFKPFNDHYGHQAGDECLKAVATAINSICHRPSDMVARYGGEEFGIILPGTDLSGALRIAELAREAVVRLKILHAQSLAVEFVSISGGVAATTANDAYTAEQLIEAADRSLYEAKHRGRNRMISAPDQRAQAEQANQTAKAVQAS